MEECNNFSLANAQLKWSYNFALTHHIMEYLGDLLSI